LLWITNYRDFTASWAAMKRIPCGRALSYVMAVPLWLSDIRCTAALNRVRGDARLQWCTGFDERFDVFWDALVRRRRGMLLGVRTRDVLEWHFRHAIRQKKVWILTMHEGSDIAGYCIFLRQDNPRYGLERMRLIDFQTLDGDINRLRPAVGCALQRCREEGVHMLEYVGMSPDAEQVLQPLAPHRRDLPCWSYYYKATSHSLASRLHDARSWSPSSFDGDSSL
jgi:hypothetical protein